MRKDVAVVVGLLVGTNTAWAVFTYLDWSGPCAGPATKPDPEAERRLRELEARAAEREKAPQAGFTPSRTAPKPEGGGGGAPASERPRPGPSAEETDAKRKAEAAKRSQEQLAQWKADVLQVTDPARRESGLVAIEGAIRSGDAAAATAALHTLYDLRDAAYDKKRFREAVLSRLSGGEETVRVAAGWALMNVAREDGDAERVMAAVESMGEAGNGVLIVATWMSKNRVEGRLADLYVKALSTADARRALDTASSLRGTWVTPEVEDAVLSAWKRDGEAQAGSGGGLWLYVLGQMAPAREPRVKVLFEMLKKDDTRAPHLLDRALTRDLDASARPTAARLAMAGLPTAPNAAIRRLFLDVLRRFGTAEQAPALGAFAANAMVAEDLRKQAADVADEIAKRR